MREFVFLCVVINRQKHIVRLKSKPLASLNDGYQPGHSLLFYSSPSNFDLASQGPLGAFGGVGFCLTLQLWFSDCVDFMSLVVYITKLGGQKS